MLKVAEQPTGAEDKSYAHLMGACTIAQRYSHGNSGEDRKLGRVAYFGDNAGLKCFKVVFTDGCYDSCHAQLLAVAICVILLVGFSIEVILPRLVQ
jgi:hypothetical protein